MTTYQGRLEQDVNLARYCTWRVGGPAQYVFYPKDLHDLSHFLAHNQYAPYTWLGLGSNVLIRDGGIPGTVIFTQDFLDEIIEINEHTLFVEAGVPCAKIAKFCARLGLAETEFFAGIPGTLGGALAMNAGAYGGETWTSVVQVETINANGVVQARDPAEYQIGYRTVKGPDEWFVSATLRFKKGDTTEASARIKELLHQRNEAQPIGLPSGGSVFRNPPGNYAARLIESSGLKGCQIGGAQVSPKHANFIINTGEAKASDIENLIAHLQKIVYDLHGILLEPEVRILGVHN
jgi:UDP-N-acetylmuramate dehydrogenase